MPTILSLDVSTTCIGISVLSYSDSKISLLYSDHYVPIKKGDILERISKAKDHIFDLIDTYKPDNIAIEKHIEYMRKSNSKTILSLAIFNQVLAFAIYEKTSELPTILNVNTIRAAIKIPGTKGRLKKLDVPKAIEHHLGAPWVYLRKGSKILSANYDRADAVAVGLAFIALKKKKGAN